MRPAQLAALTNMTSFEPKRFRILAWVLGILLLLLALVLVFVWPHFNQKGYYEIGFIINSKEMRDNDMQVVQTVISEQLNKINQEGGVRGKKLRVRYLDDEGSPDKARELVEESIKDEHLIAYIGCWSSVRTFAFAPLLKEHQVPLLGGYAMTPLFEDNPSMFTSEASINEVYEVLAQLLDKKSTRVAFIGKSGDLYSEELLNRYKARKGRGRAAKLVLEKWYASDHVYTKQEWADLVKELNAEADFLVLSFEAATTQKLVQQLRRSGVDIPVFIALAEIGHVIDLAEGKDLGELYDLTVSGIPGALNLGLREMIESLRRKMGRVYEHQVAFSARYADAVALIAATAEDFPKKDVRQSIVDGLQLYVGGNRSYPGSFTDWYFNPDRSLATDMLVAWKKPDLPQAVLAPSQLIYSNSTVKEVPVYYTHLNMTEISQVNDTEGTFYASFYLEISSFRPIHIEHFDFTNASRSGSDHAPMLEITTLREQADEVKHYYNTLYKVSGKFYFEPDLRNYPFDQQKFPISFQPRSTLNQFLIQPSEVFYRDSLLDVRGWKYRGQFVGYDHEAIYSVEPYDVERYLVQFYRFNYTYLLSRTQVDFFLKVLTPLLVILVITYFSVYIPLNKFETLEAIQVTSLLASIALYFSSYKPQMESATVSDKVFIFTYLMITSLIGTSILQYVKRNKQCTESIVAKIYQRYVYPLIIAIVTLVLVAN